MSLLRMGCLALSALFLANGQAMAQDETKETPEQRLKDIEGQFDADIKIWRAAEKKKADDAKESGKPMPAMSMMPPKEIFTKFIALHQKAAGEYKGSDGAIPFLTWVLRLGGAAEDGAALKGAADTLTTDHIKSAKIEDATFAISMAGRVIGKEVAQGYLDTISKQSPHGRVKARVILLRIGQTLQSAPVDSEEYKKARAEALHAIEIAKDEALTGEIQGMIDGREKMDMGQVAPDISGVDLDGTAFKLSDYKGKVIMLDFWGDW